ncbi:hypothetical protein [Desulfovibrio piger]|uniref:hypothetical protein n=1 Tax=Desulfovibrio piger TaxID=901 RepID=UPI0026E9A753|nr:hypothetical protein [Desulfovibrio piger]
MQLTKGAIGNLINRYKAVLKKCHLMNTFGSLAVAGMLVMGGAAAAGAADALDVALEGEKTYDSTETPEVNHLMGGWLVKDAATAGDAKGDITLTVNGGNISEIIGGSYVKANSAFNGKLTHGTITTTIEGTTSSQFVVGGSKIANSENAHLKTGDISLTIKGGTFGTKDNTGGYELVMGGNYLKADKSAADKSTAQAGDISVKIEGGKFHASVVGGSTAHVYPSNGENIPNLSVTDGSTSVTITGGTFNPSETNLIDANGGINLKAAVIGGGLAYGANTSTVLGSDTRDVTSRVTINGGEIHGKVVAGSVVANGGYAAVIHGDTLLDMRGGTVNDDLVGGGMVQDATSLSGEDAPSHNLIVTGNAGVTVDGGTATGEIVGGNYVRGNGSARVANSLVTITGGEFASDTANKAQYVIGGNKSMAYGSSSNKPAADVATTLVKGNSGVLVDGAVKIVDGAVVGGSMAKAENDGKATATVAGNSGVQVDKGTLAGVVGGGIAETYYGGGGSAVSEVKGTSFVAINGGTIKGIAYGAVADNADTSSAAVVGGGLANDKGSTATVGSTRVTIADGTINGKVVAGGLAINGGTTTVEGNTLLTMTDGEVSGDLIGGNLLEKNGKDGGSIASTTVSVESGTVAGEIYGGSYVRNTAGTSEVANTTVNINGGTIGAKVPQGWAQYVVGGGKAMSNATETESNVLETAAVNISDGDITRGAVVGGGFARAQGASGSATANVKDSVVNLTGGSLVGVVGGGLAENLSTGATATADVTNASLTIDGNATVNGIIYKGNDGVEAEPSSAAVIGGGLAYSKKGSTAVASVVKTASTTIKGGTINGDVYAGGMADGTGAKAEVTNANLTIKGGEINGNIYAGGYALNAGTATVANATVTFDGNSSFAKTVQGGNATNSTLAFTNYNGTFDGQVVGFTKLDVAEGSTLKLQTLSTGTTAEKKAGVFNNNALTLTGAGNVEADAVNVVADKGLTIQNGTLTVTGSLKSAEDGDGTDGINVSGNGVLTAANNLLVTNTDGTIAIADDLNKLYLGNGGTLAVTGLDSISTTDMVSYHSALVVSGSTGLIKYEGAAIEISRDDKTDSGNLKGSVAEQTGALLTDTTVEYGAPGYTDTTTINGNYGAKTVLISNAANGEHTINLNGNLTLLGDGTNLITVKGEGTPKLSQVNVDSGKALNLGSAAAPSRGGNLGADVELGDGSSLNAVAGDYTVGAVKGTADNYGTVSSSAGGRLVAESIGEGEHVAAVNASQGSIHSTGVIRTGKLTIDGGVVSSDRTISVFQAVENMNGTLAAESTISLNKGATNAQGQIVTGGHLTLKGGITKAADGTLDIIVDKDIKASGKNIEATNLQARSMDAKAVSVEGGSLLLAKASTVENLDLVKTGISVADLTVTGDVTMTDGSAGMIDKLDAQRNVTIGKTDSDGVSLVVKEMTTQAGTTMTFDPDWGYASNNAATEKQNYDAITDSNAVNNALQVGRNSYVALGTTDQSWLPSVVQGGLREGGVETVLGLAKSLVVQSTGSIELNSDAGYVAGSVWAPAPNTAKFGANSLLVVNGANIYGDKAAIKFADASGGTLTVSEGAKLLVTDAVAGQTYTIVDKVASVTGMMAGGPLAGWKTEGLSTTTDMISLDDAVFTPGSTGAAGTVTTSAKRNDAATVFPNLSDGMANAVNDLYTGHDGAAGEPRWDYADVDSADMGVRFLSRATDNRFLGADKDAAAATIESAARIAFAGAVPQMTKMASDAGSNAVVNRLGFANPADGAQAMNAEGKIVDRNTTGFALWIAPLWQSQHGWGMEADNLDYGFNGNLGGVSLGADYTFENAIRAGITFNIGGGYAESSGGDLNSTENRMSFWGLGAYAGWNYENFGLMADVSYTSTWNDLQQDMDSRMGMGDLEADVQASAISAGLRAEYKLETSVLDVIPHIGVRYMSLNTWGFDAESNGGTVLEGDGFHQDIWTFPVGVTFTKDFTLDSGWSFKPSIDFSVIPAAGDIKAKQDVAFTGLPGSYEVETQMMDYLTWQGGVGLEMGNDTMSFGVNYTLQAGQHTTGHGVFGSFRYEF